MAHLAEMHVEAVLHIIADELQFYGEFVTLFETQTKETTQSNRTI